MEVSFETADQNDKAGSDHPAPFLDRLQERKCAQPELEATGASGAVSSSQCGAKSHRPFLKVPK